MGLLQGRFWVSLGSTSTLWYMSWGPDKGSTIVWIVDYLEVKGTSNWVIALLRSR